jgi:hypothetical protein
LFQSHIQPHNLFSGSILCAFRRIHKTREISVTERSWFVISQVAGSSPANGSRKFNNLGIARVFRARRSDWQQRWQQPASQSSFWKFFGRLHGHLWRFDEERKLAMRVPSLLGGLWPRPEINLVGDDPGVVRDRRERQRRHTAPNQYPCDQRRLSPTPPFTKAWPTSSITVIIFATTPPEIAHLFNAASGKCPERGAGEFRRRLYMKRSLLLCVFLITTAAFAAPGPRALYGTWRLVSFTRTVVSTGETTDIFGKTPHGFLTYGPDRRMMAVIAKDDRLKPADLATMTDQQRADLFRTMIAYAGTYSFDGKTMTHHVDISWNEIWTGTDQVRNVKFEGSRLILSTNPQPSSADGKISVSVLTWERAK